MAKEEAEIKELSKKLAQQPDSMVFVQLADAYRRAGDLEQSVQVCLKGLERHPTYTTARAVLGRNYLDLGKLDEAASEFRQIEVADPENIMAHRMLGQIYLEKGQYAEAIARQQRVLALDPDDTTAQELLQEALKQAKQHESVPKAQQAPAAAAAPQSDQLQTLKVADIYIKKGAFDEAAEVLQEVLSADPSNALAQQKLKEVNQRRGQKGDAGAAEAKQKAEAEAEAKRKADDEAKQKAEAEAKRKADEEARQKAEAEAKAKQKAEAEAEAKRKADEEARSKAEAEAKQKADAEAEAKRKADEEARQKAEAAEARQRAEAEAEAGRKAMEAEAKQQAAEEAAQRKAAEEAQRQAETEAKERQANKLSSDDILSVMAGGNEELISDEPAAHAKEAPKEAAKAQAGLSDAVKASLADFIRAQAIEASLLLAPDGKVLDAQGSGDHASLAVSATAVFHNTEKAARAMNFGGLKQIMIVGEDTRQILFVSLKAGVLVALTGRNTNLGLLRVAVNDLVKRV